MTDVDLSQIEADLEQLPEHDPSYMLDMFLTQMQGDIEIKEVFAGWDFEAVFLDEGNGELLEVSLIPKKK